MLRRFCNQCDREIPEGVPYYSIIMYRGTEEFDKESVGEMDMCEECYKSNFRKKEEKVK